MARSAAPTSGHAAPACFRPSLRRLLAGAIGSVAVAAACGLANPYPALAASGPTPQIIHLTGSSQIIEPDLRLLCPQEPAVQPQFENVTTGKVFAIYDPKLAAIAEKVCRPSLVAPGGGNVNILNGSGKLLLVGFAPQAGSQITWGAGCGTPIQGTSVVIPVNGGCRATVTELGRQPGLALLRRDRQRGIRGGRSRLLEGAAAEPHLDRDIFSAGSVFRRRHSQLHLVRHQRDPVELHRSGLGDEPLRQHRRCRLQSAGRAVLCRRTHLCLPWPGQFQIRAGKIPEQLRKSGGQASQRADAQSRRAECLFLSGRQQLRTGECRLPQRANPDGHLFAGCVTKREQGNGARCRVRRGCSLELL